MFEATFLEYIIDILCFLLRNYLINLSLSTMFDKKNYIIDE